MRRALRLLALVLAAASSAAPRAGAQARLVVPLSATSAPTLAPATCVLTLGAPTSGLLRPSSPFLSLVAAPPAAAPIPLPAPAVPAPLFAQASPPAEDAPIFPRVIDPAAPQHVEFPRQVEAARGAAHSALASLRESVARGDWNGPGTTLDGSCCGDAAPKLAVLMRGHGLPARLVEAEFHYYVMLDLPGGQIVIDPTVRQFFGQAAAPKTVPAVFVGTVAQLRELFARNRLAKTTRYEPDRIYFSDAHDREAKLAALDRQVRTGSAREHEPLRRFLATPAPSLPAPPLVLH
jgi:hypothetical protein